MMAQVQRFLVKMPVVAPNASLSLAGQAAVLRARPLFGSITEPRVASLAARSIWHIVEAPVALDAGNPWDVCHSMVTQGLGLAGGVRPEFAEPDLQQRWISAPPNDREQALVASCAADGQKTGPDGFPGALDNFWYQDDAHGQFARALADLPLA
ncbi:MAG: peptidase S8, partial [Proteobacteria bacterium]|nr:peptidase S8 [Pseudomonadota bacterium]